MTQTELDFEQTTSREAHIDAEFSGRAETNRQHCLSLVIANPGLTAVELCSLQRTMDRHEVSRRLPELRKMGLVVNGPARMCAINQTRQMTWNPSHG